MDGVSDRPGGRWRILHYTLRRRYRPKGDLRLHVSHGFGRATYRAQLDPRFSAIAWVHHRVGRAAYQEDIQRD